MKQNSQIKIKFYFNYLIHTNKYQLIDVKQISYYKNYMIMFILKLPVRDGMYGSKKYGKVF